MQPSVNDDDICFVFCGVQVQAVLEEFYVNGDIQDVATTLEVMTCASSECFEFGFCRSAIGSYCYIK